MIRRTAPSPGAAQPQVTDDAFRRGHAITSP